MNWYAELRNASARQRIEAAKALAQSPPANAVELLDAALQSESDPDVIAVLRHTRQYLVATLPISGAADATNTPSPTAPNISVFIGRSWQEVTRDFAAYQLEMVLYVATVMFTVFCIGYLYVASMVRTLDYDYTVEYTEREIQQNPLLEAFNGITFEDIIVDEYPILRASPLLFGGLLAVLSVAVVLVHIYAESITVHVLNTRLFASDTAFATMMRSTLRLRTITWGIIAVPMGILLLLGGAGIVRAMLVPFSLFIIAEPLRFVWLFLRESKVYAVHWLKALVSLLLAYQVAGFFAGIVLQAVLAIITLVLALSIPY